MARPATRVIARLSLAACALVLAETIAARPEAEAQTPSVKVPNVSVESPKLTVPSVDDITNQVPAPARGLIEGRQDLPGSGSSPGGGGSSPSPASEGGGAGGGGAGAGAGGGGAGEATGSGRERRGPGAGARRRSSRARAAREGGRSRGEGSDRERRPGGASGRGDTGPRPTPTDPRGAPGAAGNAPGGGKAGPDDPHGGSIVPQAIRDIVEVIPGPVKIAIAALSALALLLLAGYVLTGARARRLRRQRERLLEDVGLLQAALLPKVPERLAGVPVSVAYRPAEGLAAGGDFYDAFELDEARVGFIVGDVSGHGREALAHTTLVHYTLRTYLDAGLEPRRALQVTDEAIGAELDGEFATVVVAAYDASSGTLTYASAGHPPPILQGPAEHEPVMELSSPPIGAGLPTGRRQTTVDLPAGSGVCLYTDGLIEARVDGELLGRDRLAEKLSAIGPDATARSLIDAVHADADDASDDMAACIFSAGKHARGDGTRLEELEVDSRALERTGVERFLEACRIPKGEIPAAISGARAEAAAPGTALLRVEIAEDAASARVAPRAEEALAVAS